MSVIYPLLITNFVILAVVAFGVRLLARTAHRYALIFFSIATSLGLIWIAFSYPRSEVLMASLLLVYCTGVATLINYLKAKNLLTATFRVTKKTGLFIAAVLIGFLLLGFATIALVMFLA